MFHFKVFPVWSALFLFLFPKSRPQTRRCCASLSLSLSLPLYDLGFCGYCLLILGLWRRGEKHELYVMDMVTSHVVPIITLLARGVCGGLLDASPSILQQGWLGGEAPESADILPIIQSLCRGIDS